MPANLENSAMASGLEKVIFHSNPKRKTMPKNAQITTQLHSSLLSHFSRVQLFVTPWMAACQASLSFTISRSLLRFMCIESVMPSNHLILCRPLLFCLQSFPASGSFPVSQFFESGDQNIGASALASVLPMSIQG